MSADYNTLPNSVRSQGGEKVGIQAAGYLDKKGVSSPKKLNFMPPGTDIDNQEMSDIRSMEMKSITPQGYPGDGW